MDFILRISSKATVLQTIIQYFFSLYFLVSNKRLSPSSGFTKGIVKVVYLSSILIRHCTAMRQQLEGLRHKEMNFPQF
jgi:hypothetical protein